MVPLKKPKRDLKDIMKDLEHLEVQMGHPLGAKGLSEEEEKRVDERGNPITSGLLWSQSGTGLYLCLAASWDAPCLEPPFIYASATGTMNRLVFSVVSTMGEPPRFRTTGWGAWVEIPADLGDDDIKKDYITAWIYGMSVQIFTEAVKEGWQGLPSTDGFNAWLQAACEEAIRRTGI